MAPRRKPRTSTHACRVTVTKKHGKRCQWAKGKRTCDTDELSVLQCEKHRLAWSVRAVLRNRQSQGFHRILSELKDANERAENLFRGRSGSRAQSPYKAQTRCRRTRRTVQGRKEPNARYQPCIQDNPRFPRVHTMEMQEQLGCLCSKIIWHLEDVPSTVEEYIAMLENAIDEVASYIK